MKNESYKFLDTVPILKDGPERKVLIGRVRKIVEEMNDEFFAVEFSDKNGETIWEFAHKTDDLMLLHYEMEFVGK